MIIIMPLLFLVLVLCISLSKSTKTIMSEGKTKIFIAIKFFVTNYMVLIVTCDISKAA